MSKLSNLPNIGTLLARVRQQQFSRNIQERAIELFSTAGYRLQCRLFYPLGNIPNNGVILCPPFEQGIAFYQNWNGLIHAHRIAALQYAVLAIDPAGCGNSWGEDDKGGTEHADNVFQAIEWLSSHCSSLGLLSTATGLSMALGGMADTRIQWLIDIDGLCDPDMILEQHPTLPAVRTQNFWKSRDPSLKFTGLDRPYFRIQNTQNIQNLRRTLHLIQAQNPPFFQLNNHPRNHIPDLIDDERLSNGQARKTVIKTLQFLKTLAD